MKRFIVLLALLLLGAAQAGTAHATTGRERFAVGIKDNLELAARIDTSLRIDPKGNRPITPERCQANGDSCATPQMYLVMFKKADPASVNLTNVGDLSSYTRKLVMIDAPAGQYWMACLKPPKGGVIVAIWNCISRSFHSGEKVYANPDTKRPVLAGDCTNPVGERVPERDCDEIHIWLNKGDEPRVMPMGPDPIPDDVCRPALKRPGDVEWDYALKDEFLRANCDYTEVSEALRRKTLWKSCVSFHADVEGEYILRVSRFFERTEDVFVFCLLWPDGTQSAGTVISKASYGTYGWSYIDYTGTKALSTEARRKIGWQGLVHTWQRANRRAFAGDRPDPK